MPTAHCPRCGDPIEQKSGQRGRPSIYCSKNCAQLASLRRRDGVAIDGPPAGTCEHTCPACGKLFLSWASRIFCSMDCRSTHTRGRSAPHCFRCGESVPPQPGRGAPRKYCSRHCGQIAKSRIQRGFPITVLEHGTSEHTCQVCGKLFWGNVHARFCSRQCQGKALVPRLCERCGKRFEALRGKKYCSEKCEFSGVKSRCIECGGTADGRQEKRFCSSRCHRRFYSRRRRHIIKLGLFVEDVSITVLIKRDRGMCQLCNGPVNLKAKWPDSDSPSIDHVVPLVRARGARLPQHPTRPPRLQCSQKGQGRRHAFLTTDECKTQA